MTFLTDPFQKVLNDAFNIKPFVYTLPVTRTKGEVFIKTSIQKQENDTYRVSISHFVDGNHDTIVDEVKTLELAKKFISDNK